MNNKLEIIVAEIKTELKNLTNAVNEMKAQISCFATKEDVHEVDVKVKDNKLELEKLKNKILWASGAVAAVIYVLSRYDIKIFN